MRADVIALAVQLRRIMDFEKYVEDFVKANDVGIKYNPDCFGVARFAATNGFISRVGNTTTDIAAFDAVNAAKAIKYSLDAPESSGGQCCGFSCHARSPFLAKIGSGSQAASSSALKSDRKSTRLNSSHPSISRMPSSA